VFLEIDSNSRLTNENISETFNHERILLQGQVNFIPTIFFQTNSGKTKKFKVKVEDTFSNNPWCVDDATAFLKFCCPECDYHIPDLEMFSDHAVENHIKSSALFGEETKNEEGVLLVKQEELEYENNDDYLEQNDAMQTDDYVSYSHYEENDYPSQGSLLRGIVIRSSVALSVV
jgi:hypothetical protein